MKPSALLAFALLLTVPPRDLSYEEIRLSVLERNAAGRMFWESLGFGIAKAQKDGNLSMRYALARREESPRRSCKSLLMKNEKEAGEGI